MSSSVSQSLAAFAVLSLVSAGPVSAQVCGDADGSGTVTVTDGVQTLRSAAGLSSSCTPAGCDVDGSGTITVTDGVNVLRKAAGLAITENCPAASLDAQVENLLRGTLPVFGALIKSGSSASSARAAETFECDNVGGTFTVDDQELSFDDCVFAEDGLRYDGYFRFGSSQLDFEITLTDLATGNFDSLAGSFSEQVSGTTSILNGFFALDSSSLGSFDVEFDQLTLDQSLNFIGGALEFSIDDAAFEDVDSIRMTFDPSTIALVEVQLAGGAVASFNYDLLSGELTPISN